jgi:RNA polymerase sigma-70 factor (ECF subfamily)
MAPARREGDGVTERDELELGERLRRHDDRALGELYDRYGRQAYYLIYRVVGDHATAEDLVQETFLRVWNGIGAFDLERGTLGRWVLTVARNQAIDYLRSWQGRVARGAVPVDDWTRVHGAGGELQAVARIDRRRTLGRALRNLTQRQRELLRLAYVDGLTHSELAMRLALPLGTVKTWMRGALQALRAEMAG